MMHYTKLSLEIVSSCIALVISSFLADIDLNNILDNVTEMASCAGTLKNIMIDEGVDKIYLKKRL